jgi:hypothetical protein
MQAPQKGNIKKSRIDDGPQASTMEMGMTPPQPATC